MTTYNTLYQKFEDKGRLYDFLLLVPAPPFFNPYDSRYIEGMPLEIKQQIQGEMLKKFYQEDWDYWNAWIDRQNNKY